MSLINQNVLDLITGEAYSTNVWEGGNFLSFIGKYVDTNTFKLFSLRNITGLHDDDLVKTYIQIKINL